MIENLSANLARRGKNSQMSIPGTLVRIGRNSPRYSAGASGFMSNMSRCGGPPLRWMLMIAFFDAGAAPSARNSPARESPPMPVAPIRKKARLDTPSQDFTRFPKNVSTVDLLHQNGRQSEWIFSGAARPPSTPRSSEWRTRQGEREEAGSRGRLLAFVDWSGGFTAYLSTRITDVLGGREAGSSIL